MSAADVTGWLDRLEETHKAATPGPWEATSPRADGGAYIDSTATRLSDGSAPWVGRAHRERDAAAIVAAHNALPQLVAAVRGVLTEAEALDRFADAVPYAATGSYDDGRKRAQANAAARIRTAVTSALGAEVTGR